MKKLLAFTALLAAITTTTAHADLISRTDEPLSFSITYEFTPGASDSYSTPSPTNWDVILSLSPEEGSSVVSLIAFHRVAPHSPPEIPFGNAFSATLSLDPALGRPSSAAGTLNHPAIPGHVDVFSANLELKTVPGAATVWLLTLTGEHQGAVAAVPDTTSSILLLGLALTALSTARRLLRLWTDLHFSN